MLQPTGVGLRCFWVNTCANKLLGKEAVTFVNFLGDLAAHLGQMEKVISVYPEKAPFTQGRHCMAHAGL